MVYPRVKALLQDNGYVSQLLNLLLPLDGRENAYSPISEGWIQDTESEELTRRYQQMTMQDGAYINVVRVVRDPAVSNVPTSVENEADRQRYILLTVVPDVPHSFEMNFPLIQTMGVLALFSCELSRAVTRASQEMENVIIMDKPIPPILNNAVVEWISIYVGRKPYEAIEPVSTGNDGLSLDIHLHKAREKMDEPLLSKLVENYDADFAAQSSRSGNMA